MTADTGGRWTLSLVEDGHRLDLPLDGEGWTVSEQPCPAAVSGGWSDDATFTADVVFLETPHRLGVTCSLTDRTFTAHWRTRPLSPGPLHRLRAPRGSVPAGGRPERPQERP